MKKYSFPLSCRPDQSEGFRPLPGRRGKRHCSSREAGRHRRHEPAAVSLLHQLLTQHVPHRWNPADETSVCVVVGRGLKRLCVCPQWVSWRVCRRWRCTGRCCWPAAAASSWTAGRGRMRSRTSRTGSPWPPRFPLRCSDQNFILELSCFNKTAFRSPKKGFSFWNAIPLPATKLEWCCFFF